MFRGINEEDSEMDEVTVTRADLISALTENRSKHAQEYEDAMDGWKDATMVYVADLGKRILARQRGEEWKAIYPPTKPTNHLREYDRALLMAQKSVKDEVTLTSEAFAQFFMDEWHWKSAFTASNSAYIAQSRSK